MTHSLSLVGAIKETGFSCTRCGTCCKESEPGSNLVMVGPEEISRIIERSGLSFEDIVEPYPDRIQEGGKDYTFGWVLRRKNDQCMFLERNRCIIYEVRPWICQTYPFMLDNSGLSVHPCEGIRTVNHTNDAQEMALNLEKRLEYEQDQDDKILKILSSHSIPAGKPVVIDAEGIKEYHG